jgi:GDP/UDP-N,N'-diacetylbacillosamine 2-epimerase (hydrolysing)
MNKRICVVTGSRAEYGLLLWLMKHIQESSSLELQVIATGMHLSPEFGSTVRDIEADGFRVDRRVEMLLSSSTTVGVTKSIGLGLIGFADALAELQPDLVLLLGDRYEIFAAASAAMIAQIPIAHLHGGERTEGAFDDSIRHSITKMSHLHFVAAEEYRRRVIQLGELPERVFCVGGLGVDSIRRLKLLTRSQLETAIDFKLGLRNLLITFHPVTLDRESSDLQMNELLGALSELEDTNLVFTMPNSDPEGLSLFGQIEDFCSRRDHAKAFISLGQLRYLSCVKHFDGVIGNSSSGLLEVPSFKKGTVNIGDRQHGRLRADSVIDCAPDRVSIGSALGQLYSKEFEERLRNTKNPYGEGGACDAIIEILEQSSLDDLLKKCFYDYAEQSSDQLV